VFPILLKQLDLDNILDEEIDSGFSVVNNACWSAGEIALSYGKAMGPYIPELLQRCVEIMSNPRVPKGVSENAAIALGRLGLENHELLAPHLPTFAEEFLNAMDDVDASEEKATAFHGFTMVVAQNPQAMEKDLLHFFTAIARYKDLKLRSPTKLNLHDVFQNVSQAPHPMMGDFHPLSACTGELTRGRPDHTGDWYLPAIDTAVQRILGSAAATGPGSPQGRLCYLDSRSHLPGIEAVPLSKLHCWLEVMAVMAPEVAVEWGRLPHGGGGRVRAVGQKKGFGKGSDVVWVQQVGELRFANCSGWHSASETARKAC
jgi:hypothetical protein